MLSNTRKYGYVKNIRANELQAIAHGIYDPSVDPERAIKLLNEAEAIRSKKKDWAMHAEFLGFLSLWIPWMLAGPIFSKGLYKGTELFVGSAVYITFACRWVFGVLLYKPKPKPIAKIYETFYLSQMSRYENEIKKENDRHVQQKILLLNRVIIVDHFVQEYERMSQSKLSVDDRETIADLKRQSKLNQEAIDQEFSNHIKRVEEIRSNYFFTT